MLLYFWLQRFPVVRVCSAFFHSALFSSNWLGYLCGVNVFSPPSVSDVLMFCTRGSTVQTNSPSLFSGSQLPSCSSTFYCQRNKTQQRYKSIFTASVAAVMNAQCSNKWESCLKARRHWLSLSTCPVQQRGSGTCLCGDTLWLMNLIFAAVLCHIDGWEMRSAGLQILTAAACLQRIVCEFRWSSTENQAGGISSPNPTVH